MRLYFLRHAEAEDGPVDAVRPLTRKGRRDARRMGRYLAGQDTAFTLAFTSPLVRARETAELVLRECPLVGRARLRVVDDLLNDTSETVFGRWLGRLPESAVALFVGHEPSLSAHARRLLRMEVVDALPLSKGAVIRIDSEDCRAGTLKFLIGPKQLP